MRSVEGPVYREILAVERKDMFDIESFTGGNDGGIGKIHRQIFIAIMQVKDPF